MPSYSKNDVLVRYPFSDLTNAKVRPGVAVHMPHASQDSFVVPLTSRTSGLLTGEFVLTDWASAGLHVPSAVKRGLFTIHPALVVRLLGKLSQADAQQLERSLRDWLGL